MILPPFANKKYTGQMKDSEYYDNVLDLFQRHISPLTYRCWPLTPIEKEEKRKEKVKRRKNKHHSYRNPWKITIRNVATPECRIIRKRYPTDQLLLIVGNNVVNKKFEKKTRRMTHL